MTGKRADADGTFRSFTIESDAGRELLCNNRFLKHEWKSRSKHVRFNLPDSDPGNAGSEMNVSSKTLILSLTGH